MQLLNTEKSVLFVPLAWLASRSLQGSPPTHEATADAPAFALARSATAKAGAGDETRTRDVLLGKEVLYH
jgi:hypothetical protein